MIRTQSISYLSPRQTPRPSPPPTYQWQEGVEDLENYCSGGYHPVHIGDRYLDNRHEVIHKLGYGSYSTVWLAQDHLTAKPVALKIIVASASDTFSESRILRKLQTHSSRVNDHRGQAYVSSLLDEFSIDGPNGRHRCIVSDAYGCSVARSKDASLTWKFSVEVARAIAAQLILGLDYIHSCGVVHGDIHSNNILFRFPYPEGLSIDDLCQRLGPPQKLPINRLDQTPNDSPGVPQYCVPPALIVKSIEDVTDARVLIADFGEAFSFHSHNDIRVDIGVDGDIDEDTPKTKNLHTPVLLTPPESFFNEPLGPSVDMWTLGCTLYEILGKRPLFEGFMPDQDHVLAEMVSTLGLEVFPSRWWRRWERRVEFFCEDGSWKTGTVRRHAPYSRPLGERLRIMGRGEDPSTCGFSVREMVAVEGLLRGMLAYEPGERRGGLDSEWMGEWGRRALSSLKIS